VRRQTSWWCGRLLWLCDVDDVVVWTATSCSFFRVYSVMAVRQTSVERGTLASHSLATSTVKAPSVPPATWRCQHCRWAQQGRLPQRGRANHCHAWRRGAMAKALPILWVDDGDAFERRSLPWKCLSKGPLLLHGVFLPGCITLTFWSGDGGIGAIVPLLGGIAWKVVCPVRLWRRLVPWQGRWRPS
jgi:hypothetical protein